MVEDPNSESAAQHERYVAAVRVPQHRWLYYEYDTGKLRSLHLLQLPCCADIEPITIGALHGNMLWLTLNPSHAFAGDPEDAISRKHKLHLEHEKYIVTGVGGKHTHQTHDVFCNQQIMQTSRQRLKVISISSLSSDAGQPETVSQPLCTADQAKHSASAQSEKVMCSTTDVHIYIYSFHHRLLA